MDSESRDLFSRTEKLIGKEAVERLSQCHVALFGLGGVGSYAAEALVRGGIGVLTVVDHDTVAQSNINRQLYALNSTLGKYKTEVAADRLQDINPELDLHTHCCFFSKETKPEFNFSSFHYVIDAIDTVTSKLLLAETCMEYQTPLISCMGTGNKLNPERLRIGDIAETTVCPLARVMRRELKKRGIFHLPVVFSDEAPMANDTSDTDEAQTQGRRSVPGSISFVPPVAGMLLASAVIRSLTDRFSEPR